jgi:hypothetical protein
MPKYQPSDDGKAIDGRIVIFLWPSTTRQHQEQEQAEDGSKGESGKSNGNAQQQEGQPQKKNDADQEPEAGRSKLATLEAAHFELDRTFPLPSSLRVLAAVRSVLHDDPARSLLVAGHTDAQGSDTYNLNLSQQRAEIVAAALQSNAHRWLANYSRPRAGQQWGSREDAWMLSEVPSRDATYLPGGPGGGGDLESATRKYQQAKNLAVDGVAGRQTRAALIADYLALLTPELPAGMHVETLACGERHLIPGASEEEDRRVELFAFEGEIAPPASACREAPTHPCAAYGQWVKNSEPLHLDGTQPVGAEFPYSS